MNKLEKRDYLLTLHKRRIEIKNLQRNRPESLSKETIRFFRGLKKEVNTLNRVLSSHKNILILLGKNEFRKYRAYQRMRKTTNSQAYHEPTDF